MKFLRAKNIKRCIGCHICSLTCARQVHGLISWDASGIRILSSGGISTGFEARFCLACKEPACAQVCPTEAIKKRGDRGIRFKKDLCIRCDKCFEKCPVGAIAKDHAGYPIVCIHCGLCVKYCPHNCLELEEC